MRACCGALAAGAASGAAGGAGSSAYMQRACACTCVCMCMCTCMCVCMCTCRAPRDSQLARVVAHSPRHALEQRRALAHEDRVDEMRAVGREYLVCLRPQSHLLAQRRRASGGGHDAHRTAVRRESATQRGLEIRLRGEVAPAAGLQPGAGTWHHKRVARRLCGVEGRGWWLVEGARCEVRGCEGGSTGWRQQACEARRWSRPHRACAAWRSTLALSALRK